MTTLGQITLVNSGMNITERFSVQKNHQNSLKGLLWGSVGASLTTGALVLTAATVGAVAGSIFGLPLAHSVLPGFVSRSLPSVLTGVSSMVLSDYLVVKATGACFSNAIHHLGPEYKIVKE